MLMAVIFMRKDSRAIEKRQEPCVTTAVLKCRITIWHSTNLISLFESVVSSPLTISHLPHGISKITLQDTEGRFSIA